jgi:NitT/TauT family transport system substrate-binding protein
MPGLRRAALLRAGAAAGLVPLLPPRLLAQQLQARVAIIPIDTSCALYVAQAQGRLVAGGLDVDVVTMANGGAVSNALVTGAIDIGSINVLSIAEANERGIPFKIVAPGSLHTPRTNTYGMMVRNDSPIRSVRELGGKTVSVNILEGIGHIAALAWIDENGGNSKAVRFVEIPFPAMAPALAAGRIDAAIMTEPGMSSVAGEARSIGSPYDGVGARWMVDAWVAREAWLADHLDVAQRFAAILLEAGKWANRHRDQTAPIVANAMKLDPALVRSMRRDTFVERSDPALVQPMIDVGARYGVLRSRFPAATLFASYAQRSSQTKS